MKRSVAMAVMIGCLFGLGVGLAAAQTYPTKAVRLIIPFPPGGSNDIVGRLIATELTKRLGKQVVVDNRGGAGGVLGSDLAAKATPDGYTLLIVSAAFAFNPSLHKLPFDPLKDFTPIARLGSGPNSLTVHPGLPVNTVQELLAYGKQNPGKLLCGAAGVGSFQHLGTELFKLMTGLDFKIVQYKGGGPAMTDQLGGHVQMSFGSLIQTLPHIQSGKFRVLATGGAKRSPILPNVPTIAEAGVPGYEATNWWGVVAPAGTPQPIVERLSTDLAATVTSDEVQKLFLKEGAEADHLVPAEFSKFIASEIAKWSKVVKDANIKAE